MNIKKIRRISLAVLASAVLAACGTSGTMVRANGTADELYWPAPASTTFNKDRGTFPIGKFETNSFWHEQRPTL